MKQKEEIRERKKQLKKAEEELGEKEKDFEETFGDVVEEIQHLRGKRARIHTKINSIKLACAKVLSDRPERYATGSSHLLNEQIKEYGDSLEIARTAFGTNYQGAVWNSFQKEIKDNSEIRKLNEKDDKLFTCIATMEDGDAFNTAKTEIESLKRSVAIRTTTIERLSRQGEFSQYAKEQKEKEEQKKIEEEIAKKLEQFKTWFDKNIKPEMQKAIQNAIKVE